MTIPQRKPFLRSHPVITILQRVQSRQRHQSRRANQPKPQPLRRNQPRARPKQPSLLQRKQFQLNPVQVQRTLRQLPSEFWSILTSTVQALPQDFRVLPNMPSTEAVSSYPTLRITLQISVQQQRHSSMENTWIRVYLAAVDSLITERMPVKP